MSTSYPLHKIKVVLFESIHERGAEIFHKAGYTVERYDVAFAGDELVEKIADAHIIGIRSKTKVTADVLARAPRLMGIGCFCIGTNQVDLAAAAAAGVPVFNEAFSNTRSVAEKVIAEIIVLHRKLFQRSSEMHQGLWKKSAIGSHEIRGRTLGIIGYGRI
ncbi:MAG: D-3-phosphoglycerate dehydrogenase, partial [Myxococcota bacterium]